MATRLGRMVIYLDGLLPIKSHGLLITWSCRYIFNNTVSIATKMIT